MKMNPAIIFVHCAGDQSGTKGSSQLLNWLSKNLGNHHVILSPKMHNTHEPDCITWMDHIDAVIHQVNRPLILIGHSLGSSVILKYLTERVVENEIFGIHLLATPYWGNDPQWISEEFQLDNQLAQGLPYWNNLHFYHCELDEIVSIDHLQDYQDLLPNAQFHPLKTGGHYFEHEIDELIDGIKAFEQIPMKY